MFAIHTQIKLRNGYYQFFGRGKRISLVVINYIKEKDFLSNTRGEGGRVIYSIDLVSLYKLNIYEDRWV